MDLTPIPLEGPTVRLEPLCREHLDGLCTVGLDPELWRLTTSRVQERTDLARYVEDALAEQRTGFAQPFIIRRRATGDIIGSTRFGNVAPAHRRVEIGWTWLGRAWQRTGTNTEAKYLMLCHAFEHWRCLRVEFRTSVLNERSRSALRRIGAVEEGVLRRHMLWDESRADDDGSVRDTVYYSIIAEEWPTVKAHLAQLLAVHGVSVES